MRSLAGSGPRRGSLAAEAGCDPPARTRGRGIARVAAWLKYYPGLTLVGLLALRRWRSAAAFVVVAALIGVIDRAEVKRSVENGLTLMRSKTKAEAMHCHASTHSLVAHWRAIRAVRQVRWLRKISPRWRRPCCWRRLSAW